MVFEPSEPLVDKSLFKRKDWTTSEFGFSLDEALLTNMLQHRGMEFFIRAFVDADHAGDTITRRYRTGFRVYLNSAPLYWLSKKQTIFGPLLFGSEFMTMKECTEYIRGLHYKLRMMGIPSTAPVLIFSDNQSVPANTTIPDSTLNKKSQIIAYHFVW